MPAAISRVCVITRTKDRPLTLKRAVESVLNQSFEDWLHVLVNDGGNPSTLESTVSPYRGRYRGRLKIIHNEVSLGMQNASNCAITLTDSEYIAIHDDDDSWAETFLAECTGYLDSIGPADTTQGVATQSVWIFEKIDNNGNIVELSQQDYFPFKRVSLFDMGGRNVFPPIAFLYRRKVHDHIGLFDQKFNYIGDWDFHFRFLSKFDIGVIDRQLAFYHWRHKGLGSNYGNTVTDAVDEHLRLANKMRNHYLRLDLEKGKIGLGFVMNLSEKSEAHTAMLCDEKQRSNNALEKLQHIETMTDHLEKLQHIETMAGHMDKLQHIETMTDHSEKITRDLVNLSEKSEVHTAMLSDLQQRSNNVLGMLQHLETMSDYFERITRDLRRFYTLKISFYRARRRVKNFVIGVVSHLSQRLTKAAPRQTGSDEQDLNRLLRLVKVVSFDVFDTVLLRKTKCPTDVFLYMESEARKILGNPEAQFPELRVNAERIARERASEQHGYGDINLAEIYSVLRELTGVDDSALSALMELEIRSEERLIYANPDALRLRDLAVSRRKTVTFTSDMYLPQSAVAHLLEINGFSAKNLLLSSETRVTKHSGKLFDLVVKKFRGDPGKILHIGDNQWSDFEQARSRGLKSLHWRPKPEQLPFVDQIASEAANCASDLSSSIYTGLVRKRRLTYPVDDTGAEDFWKFIGYELAGPLYVSFVTWAVRQAKNLDVDKLFFLARDGYYLIQVFNILKERWKLPIDAQYVYASRRLLNLPRIRSLDEEALAFLSEPNACISLKDFFARIGLDPASYSHCIGDFGFTSLGELLTTPRGVFVSPAARENMRGLLKNLAGDILTLAADERSRLLAYLSETGITSTNSALVDIGWQASSIKSFRDLLNLNGCRPSLHGLYFSTWRFARGALDSGCPVRSFYVHLDQPEHRANLIREGVEILEAFFGAPHPSVVGLEKDNGAWCPLYGEKELDDEQQRYVELAREAAVEFALEASELLSGPDSSTPGYAYLDAVLERILWHPRPQEAHFLGQLSHRNHFGGNGPLRFVARVPSSEQRQDPRALREAYDHCYWKTGFLAQLTEEEKALLAL